LPNPTFRVRSFSEVRLHMTRPLNLESTSCHGLTEALHAVSRFRVMDVVTFEEEDESPFVGLLQIEAA
jgi:hypothetical protein